MMCRSAAWILMTWAGVLVAGMAGAETLMKTESWANSEPEFEKFAQRISSMSGRNLLARRGVKIAAGSSEATLLVDGNAGTRCEEGRVFVNGTPTEFTFYLGGAKAIHEIGVFTFNGDARANQDFEVRWAENSAKPGQMPQFPEKPCLTTGDKVLGKNGGGFHTFFVDASPSEGTVGQADRGTKPPAVQVSPSDKDTVGQADRGIRPLVAKADWVRFRIWRTYSVAAGRPAKSGEPQSGCTVIELEVLGDPKDVVVPSKEDVARREELRKAPKQPAYAKKATWPETMVAAREEIVLWECQMDRLALPETGVKLGPWHVLGPVPADSEVAAKIDQSRKIELAQPVKAKDGRTFSWAALPALEDGEMANLAEQVKAKAGEVVFLCRAFSSERPFDHQSPLYLGVGLGPGTIRLLPSGQSYQNPKPEEGRRIVQDSSPPRWMGETGGGWGFGPAVPNQKSWSPNIPGGDHQIVVRLPVAEDGSCRFWFMAQPSTSRPGAGNVQTRIGRREALYDRLIKDFASPTDAMRIGWERADSLWIASRYIIMASYERFLTDWVPGNPAFLAERYNGAVEKRLGDLAKDLEVAEPKVRALVEPWIAEFRKMDAGASKTSHPAAGAAGREEIERARARYYALATVQEAVAEAHRVESMRLAIEDQRDTFGARYAKAAEYLARVGELGKKLEAAWPAVLAGKEEALAAVLGVREEVATAGKEILLANPLLGFEKLLLVKGGPSFNSNWGGPNSLGSEVVALSPVKPDGAITTIHKLNGGSISNLDLSFDGKRLLYADGTHVFEVNVDGTGLRQITAQTDKHVQHHDPCYLPSGRIMFVSTACEQAVPCTGQWYVGNMHLMDADGKNERRLTYDQDHSWNPSVLNNGRVIFTRWEYADTPHYFSRLLFHMNPDGTEQMEYYGSNSYWPNAMYWPTAIPGHPTEIVCVVSGHHGVSRVGELVLLDPARGRQEADGVVQRLPGRGRKVEPIIRDELVLDSWPRFATPYPLAEPETNAGAGKYFLVGAQLSPRSPWGLYLVDVFDNMTPLLVGGYSNPIALRPRPTPPAIPPKVDLARRDATVYLVNVYAGEGLRGYPRGSIKALRVGTHHYRYGGNGDTYACSHEGGWDIKRILGTVPVYEDGSAYFRVPANTPIFVQPLDSAGRAQQVMRSWFTAMPGEVVSCVGCHERQNSVPGNLMTEAMRRAPSEITPWNGPMRGFGFEREVQPVLDRRCVGCHDGKPGPDGQPRPDFRAKRLFPDFKGAYSPAYLALQRYVRRAGYEADIHLPAPSEFEAQTSQLVQMLLKGHHNVKPTAEEMDRIYAWIDYNVPYAMNWREGRVVPTDDQVERRAKYKKLYANVDDHDEDVMPLPEIARFEPPAPEPPRPAPVRLDGWPLRPEDARRLQQAAGRNPIILDLGNGVTMSFVMIPAGRFVMGDTNGFPDESPEFVANVARPFYLGQFEVTHSQYAQFDPRHDSGYIESRGKDRYTRGFPVNGPRQPVVRISWREAVAFCEWLSRRTGMACRLPSETEWEWACRAGTATPWSFGERTPGLSNVGNFADGSLSGWNYGRGEQGYSDGARFSVPGGQYPANAWGLADMHGNVAEWTASEYRPYPYREGEAPAEPLLIPRDGSAGASPSQVAPSASRVTHPDDLRVVRGGSWNDLLRYSRSASRWRYPSHQPVYSVGFRVLVRSDRLARP